MLALRLYGKEDLRLEDVSEPKLDGAGAILKVRATSICATDVKAYSTGARTKIPIILGHEFSGDIIEASNEFVDYLGKKVIVNPNIFCGRCEYCLSGEHVLCPNRYAIGIDVDGSFAEYVKIPAQAFHIGGVLEIPPHLSYEEASLIEPLAACFRGQLKLGIHPGDVVTILGAGPIGLLHFLLARAFGASKIIISEVDERRKEVARRLGVEYVVDPLREDIEKSILSLTNGKGSDVVIVAVGSPQAQRDALKIIRKGGRINFFAGLPAGVEEVSINTNIIHYKQIIVLGTSMQTPMEFKKTLELVASRLIDVKPLLTHRYSLKDGLEAFSKTLKAEGLKVVINP
ncbi:MAG: zinc-binding dehydrogenase [Aigarchaeota archaeon]|nr:zinc-binding dehydrogenase [Aigarchaeota archaeon]MCX8193234.1 zinc-binding dehydrogenase [Nitrososphaeria archaeon]MDW7986375.1 zinc-binding dehydrogenase [Nitrososphaerota archaeon]